MFTIIIIYSKNILIRKIPLNSYYYIKLNQRQQYNIINRLNTYIELKTLKATNIIYNLKIPYKF